AAARHLAGAELVQDFARLLVAPVVVLRALVAGEHPQSVDCELGIESQRLVRGDDGVTPKNGGEPGNAGANGALVAIRDLQGVEVANRGLQGGVEHAVAAAENGGEALPLGIFLPPASQVSGKFVIVRRRLLALHDGSNGYLHLELLQGRQFQIPAGAALAQVGGSRPHGDHGLAQNSVPPPVIEGKMIVCHDGPIVLPVSGTRAPAHLENVHEIGFEGELDEHFHRPKVEVLKGEAVEQNIAAQQLLAADVNGVFRQVEGITQGDVAGSQFNLRNESAFRAGRQNHGAVPAYLQLQVAEKTGIVVEEADVRRAGGGDIARHRGGEESFALNQGEVVDLARLQGLKLHSRLDVGRGNFYQLRLRNRDSRAHATARCSSMRAVRLEAWPAVKMLLYSLA